MSPETRDRLAFAAAAVVVVVGAGSIRTFGVVFFTLARHYGYLAALVVALPLLPLGLAATGLFAYAVASRLLGESPAGVRRRRGMQPATLVTAAVFLAVASAGVPERVHDVRDLDTLYFGLPIPYLVQSPSYHFYGTDGIPIPDGVAPISPLEHRSDIRWWALALDVAAVAGLVFGVRWAVTRDRSGGDARRATSRERTGRTPTDA